MKIRRCFLKLQLKMLGMFFFETHCSSFSVLCVLAPEAKNAINSFPIGPADLFVLLVLYYMVLMASHKQVN